MLIFTFRTTPSGNDFRSKPSPLAILARSQPRLILPQAKKKATEMTDEDEDGGSEKKYRKCEKAGCTAACPVCFASASERSVWTGRRAFHSCPGALFPVTLPLKVVLLKIAGDAARHVTAAGFPACSAHTDRIGGPSRMSWAQGPVGVLRPPPAVPLPEVEEGMGEGWGHSGETMSSLWRPACPLLPRASASGHRQASPKPGS